MLLLIAGICFTLVGMLIVGVIFGVCLIPIMLVMMFIWHLLDNFCRAIMKEA